MNKAVLICAFLSCGHAATLRAQATMDRYDSEFMAGANDREKVSSDAPRSIADAKRTHHGYRIGARGAHDPVVTGKESHVVKPGDTLWGLSQQYFSEPWHWPELWSYNPEITNPHWIYPLDHVRLSPAALAQEQAAAQIKAGGAAGEGPKEEGPSAGILSGTETAPAVVVPKEAWLPGMIFLRDEGYLDNDALKRAGQVIGGDEEHMMLSPSDGVYIRFGKGVTVKTGQTFTIFRTIGQAERHEDEKGTLVRILGTAVVRSYDKSKGVARGIITEAIEPIERGLFVATMDRRFDLVTPKRNAANVEAHIIASVQPRTLLAYGNVVFLDVGAGHGIEPGNRFFVVRRGDAWLASIDTDPRNLGNIAEVPDYDPKLLPKEVIAELRVLKVRKDTTIALVTRSDYDIALGESAEMRAGF